MKQSLIWPAGLIAAYIAGIYMQYHIIGARMDHWLIKMGYSVQVDDTASWVIIGFVAWLAFFTILTRRWGTTMDYPADTKGEQSPWLIMLCGALAFCYSFILSFAFGVMDTPSFTWLCGIMNGVALFSMFFRLYFWYSTQMHMVDLEELKKDISSKEKANEAVS